MRQNREAESLEPENRKLAKDVHGSRAGEAAVANLVEEPVKVVGIGTMILQLLDEAAAPP